MYPREKILALVGCYEIRYLINLMPPCLPSLDQQELISEPKNWGIFLMTPVNIKCKKKKNPF